MSTKERVLAIQLLEKALKNPAFAKNLGIEAGMTKINADSKMGR